MTKGLATPNAKRLTLRRLHTEVRHLRQRIEDLEDLRDLNAAIARNQGKAGTQWGEVKGELGSFESQN